MKTKDFEKALVLKEKFDKLHSKIKNIKKLIKYIQHRVDDFQQGKVNPNNAINGVISSGFPHNAINIEFHYDNGWDDQTLDLCVFNDSWGDILNMLNAQLETYNATFKELQNEFNNI